MHRELLIKTGKVAAAIICLITLIVVVAVVFTKHAGCKAEEMLYAEEPELMCYEETNCDWGQSANCTCDSKVCLNIRDHKNGESMISEQIAQSYWICLGTFSNESCGHNAKIWEEVIPSKAGCTTVMYIEMNENKTTGRICTCNNSDYCNDEYNSISKI